ncbi:MAG: hypothetical protein ACQEWF_10290 [Bacillota bacterium]
MNKFVKQTWGKCIRKKMNNGKWKKVQTSVRFGKINAKLKKLNEGLNPLVQLY